MRKGVAAAASVPYDRAPVPDPQPSYRLVIFDFDGTLSDSGDWFLSVVDHLAERFRFRTVASGEVETLRNMSTRQVIGHLGISKWKLPFIARYVRKLVAQNTDKIHLFPRTGELLRRLDEAGVDIALVTSNAEANVRRILGQENVARIKWFECGSSLYGKAPKFRRVLKRSGRAQADVIAVGDETRDIDSAREVGLDCGAVLWGYANRDALTRLGPTATFEDVDALVRFVTGRE